MAKTSTRKAPPPSPAQLKTRANPPGGRKPGSKNKIGILLKDAIILAAEARGFDGKGKEGLTGYLKRLARDEPKAFAGLLGRVLPLHITGRVEHEHRAFRTREELVQAFKERGLPVPQMFSEALPPADDSEVIVDAEYTEVHDGEEDEEDQ